MIGCVAPSCDAAMVRVVAWLPFCEPHAVWAEAHPRAVAAIYRPEPPHNYGREDAEHARAELRADEKRDS